MTILTKSWSKKMVILFLFYLIIQFSWGQEPMNQANVWENPDYYNNLDWNNADWDKVQWERVDWNTVNWESINSANLNQILDNNPNLFDNGVFLAKFEDKINNFKSEDFSQVGREALNSWLGKKTGNSLSLAEDANVKSYKNGEIVTDGTKSSTFEIDKLPAGTTFEILSDGSLMAKDDFKGVFSGKLVYDPANKVFITDGQFTDQNKNQLFCIEVQCRIEVSKDGTVNKLSGEGTINGISAEDLGSIIIDGGKIFAMADQKNSMVAGTKLFSHEKIAYDPANKKFDGNNLLVKKTDDETVFSGKQISFLDSKGNQVATLIEGETRFSTKACFVTIVSCISGNLETGKISVYAVNSQITIDGKDYLEIELGEIKDDSQVTINKGGLNIGSCDKTGVHPRVALDQTGLKISYNHHLEDGTIADQVSDAEGDKLCISESCEEQNFVCVMKT